MKIEIRHEKAAQKLFREKAGLEPLVSTSDTNGRIKRECVCCQNYFDGGAKKGNFGCSSTFGPLQKDDSLAMQLKWTMANIEFIQGKILKVKSV